MNSPNLYKRMTWNLLFAICFVITIAMFAVGAVYAGIPMVPLLTADYGDLPDNSAGGSFPVSYDGLTIHGAVHEPVSDGLRLGPSVVDIEDDGQPDDYAGSDLSGGDDGNGLNDEDGVTRDMTQFWTNGTTVHLIVSVYGCAGTCYLNGWIDWGMDGSLVEDQIFDDRTVSNGDNLLEVVVPADTIYSQGSPVFARFRVCGSDVALPDACNALSGLTNNGEVEDYYWDFGPTAVELVSIDANTNYAVPFALLAGAVILLASGGAILAFKRRRA